MASTPRVSLKTFLATARKALTAPPAQRQNPLTFVIGNESADLDSLCSAVLLAYFRTHTPPHTLHIPLSNLPRADLALRPELGAVLHPAGLTPDDLLTLTDLPWDNLHPDQTRWLLVDHNAPTGHIAKQFTTTSTTNLLLGCIDHHDDEGITPLSTSPDAPRVFAKSGSCASLVISECKSAWSALLHKDSQQQHEPPSSPSDINIDTALAHLALGPILIDTTNLTSQEKTTKWDIDAVNFAESKISSSSNDAAARYSRTAFYESITRLKEDISRLSYRDILRKDYKRWDDGGFALGTSAVVQGFGYLTTGPERSRNELLSEVKAWAGEQGLDIVAVVTACSVDGEFTRELLVWAFGEDAIKVARQFAARNKEALGLEVWGEGDLDGGEDGKDWRACWKQKRVEHSRKRIAPMLREAMWDSSKL